MAKTSLQNMLSVLDPQKNFNWEVLIPNIPGLDDSRQFTYKALSTTIPASSIEQIKVESHGISLHYSGRRVWTGQWNVTFLEDRLNNTRAALLNWLELIRSWKDNTGSYKSQYAVPGELSLQDDTGADVRLIKVINMFPLTISEPALDQSSDVVKYDIQFSYDYTDESVGT